MRTMKMNLSEKKILSILEMDCRMPANQIAKKLKISTQGVIKIINRLIDRKVIRKFNTKINYSRMGYRLYTVHIKLAKRDNQAVKKIISVIKKYETCVWHIFCEGEYDLLLSFSIKEEKEKEEISKLLDKLSFVILEKDISVVLTAYEINKSFTEKKQLKIFQTFDHKSEREDLNEKEIKLIEILRKNSRDTILNIAEKLKLNPRSTIALMKKLQKKEVISGHKTKIDMAALGHHPCIALVTVNKLNSSQFDSFVNYCERTPGVHYFLHQLGKYDFELTFDVENIQRFYEIVQDIRDKFSFVKKITTLIEKKE